MKIYFSNRKLEKICSDQKQGIRELGDQCAKKMRQRLAELYAADNLGDISRFPPARCHELTGDRKNSFSVDLQHPYRLIFKPLGNPLPELVTGGLDLKGICEVLVTEIADTH